LERQSIELLKSLEEEEKMDFESLKGFSSNFVPNFSLRSQGFSPYKQK
jgi:hypothetical protein